MQPITEQNTLTLELFAQPNAAQMKKWRGYNRLNDS